MILRVGMLVVASGCSLVLNFDDDESSDAMVDASSDANEAGVDAARDATLDAPRDAPSDTPPDVLDATEPTDATDAPPPDVPADCRSMCPARPEGCQGEAIHVATGEIEMSHPLNLAGITLCYFACEDDPLDATCFGEVMQVASDPFYWRSEATLSLAPGCYRFELVSMDVGLASSCVITVPE